MKRTTVIAEAGVYHNGSITIAKEMVRVAKECGADIVKFQTSNLDSLVSDWAEMAEYQTKAVGSKGTQKEMLGDLVLDYEEFTELARYCSEVGIEFLSTPFDIESVRFLDTLQDKWKIPSGEITNYPYLIEIAKTKKPVILSTGMAYLNEIRDAINVLQDSGTKMITVLHCTTEYPTPIDSVNLNVMETYKREFGFPVGYSDHTRGIEVGLAAAAMGATIIEKHFTLDRNMPGPDHKASLEPDELKKMIEGIRKVDNALGSYDKTPTVQELKNRDVARKSIVASKSIKKGELLNESNITTKRPGTGISPMKWNEVLGNYAIKDFKKDELIEI